MRFPRSTGLFGGGRRLKFRTAAVYKGRGTPEPREWATNRFAGDGLGDAMAWAVFLRGVNVGGGRPFLPSAFAKEQTDLGLVNLGAAGTFVARAPVSAVRLRKAISDRLPFETEVLVCPGAEILDLLRSDHFGPVPAGAKATLTVLARAPPHAPRLPIHVPDEAAWEAKVVDVRARYVFGVYRRLSNRLTYTNPVIERAFGIPGTTRGWATVESLGKVLSET
jgi:uncharacterized protein (DUF1697 family)